MGQIYETRGYLLEDFRLFHLHGNGPESVDYHYHTFHKLIFLLGGQVAYDVEGQTYHLSAGDALLVGCGTVHRPVFLKNSPYDRVILYISPEFLEENSPPGQDLGQCFTRAGADFSFVIPQGGGLDTTVKNLEESIKATGFAREMLCKSLFFQLMILVNRGFLNAPPRQVASYDEKIRQVLEFIHNHLTEPKSMDEIAAHCFMSKYHMMRKFKSETGYSIHQYRGSKRLFLAKELLKKGNSPTETCFACGFHDYSAFARAYKKQFGSSPKGA